MNLIIIVDKYDLSFMPKLKNMLQGHNGFVISQTVSTLAELAPVIKRKKIDGIICCTVGVLARLVSAQQSGDKKDPNIMDYRGSMFYVHDTPVLILPSPKILYSVPTAPFLFKRWIQKLTNPTFPVFPKLDWDMLDASNAPKYLEQFKDAICIAVDIETTKQEIDPEIHELVPDPHPGLWVRGKAGKNSKKLANFIPTITECGYCGLFKDPKTGKFYSKAIVLPIKTMHDIELMRKFNNLAPPKIMQNGGYDSTYFLRFNSPLRNWLYDTYHFMHSWYAELPRTLHFITGLFDRDSQYWKDEHTDGNYEYNAKDTHNTLWSWIFMVQEAPQWAKDNYAENFRMVFPCITCGTEGFKSDPLAHHELREARSIAVEKNKARLDVIIAKGYNPNSSQQTLQLMKGMGYKKALGTGKVEMTKFNEAHPLHEFIGKLIATVREDRKALSTYFELSLFDGRLLYELNPSGTETGRLASKASNLWCGTQVQNIPLYAKGMYIADDGYELSAIDNGQSESRCTAYISEDANLIRTVETSPDFHCTNSSLFFGMPEGELMEVTVHEDGSTTVTVLRKDIRKVGKKVNHGANYNMGWRVLWESMGTKAVLAAKKLLKLPIEFSIRHVCEYLLNCFDTAYPDVRGKYYEEVVEEIQRTSKLTGATGWTRYCFGDPTASKPQLNSYVAHPPQSLSVKIINDAFFDCWLELQIKRGVCRMKAQVHDEIITQHKPEHREEVVGFISKRMAQATEVRGRSMVIPNDPAVGGYRWSDLKD